MWTGLLADGRVFRTVPPEAAADYGFVLESGFVPRITDDGCFVGVRKAVHKFAALRASDVRYFVEHPRVQIVRFSRSGAEGNRAVAAPLKYRGAELEYRPI